MPEHCAIYGLRPHAPEPALAERAGRLRVKWTIERVEISDPTFERHVAAFLGWLSTKAPSVELMQAIARAKQSLAITAEPGFDAESEALLRDYARAVHGVRFQKQSLLDPEGRVLRGADGRRDREARLWQSESALLRR